MKNELTIITKADYQACDTISKLGNCFVVNLRGNEISNKKDLFEALKREFTLPDANNWGAVTDWLTDLSWIEAKNFQLNVHNYNDFLNADKNAKEIFEETLVDYVLPFWEKEVLTTVVGGKTKGFSVYFIE